MSESVCIQHTNEPAVGRCRQCHVPYCAACETKGPKGTYCSAACRDKHELFAARAAGMQRRQRGPLRILLALILLLSALAVALHFAGVKIPVLSNLLGGN